MKYMGATPNNFCTKFYVFFSDSPVCGRGISPPPPFPGSVHSTGESPPALGKSTLYIYVLQSGNGPACFILLKYGYFTSTAQLKEFSEDK
jgi:hypothetical protein